MNEQANTALVKQCYDDFLKGDLHHLLSCLAENIVWEIPTVDNIPFSGTRHGRDEVASFFTELSDAQTPRQFEPREYIAQDDKVVVLGHYAWEIMATGSEWNADWAHLWTIQNGRVIGFREYGDTLAESTAFGEQAAGIASGPSAKPDTGRPSMH
ncbi:hypothetical protein SAMN06265795_113105 [Noviherbaspirillum humi]|uniref:SnoaL-like domain-containing protein n=1 Tax=Noviherbaspirillum humi TaxID=1688639 RepID=A0A239JTM1_9BURK|nr:nuclear transport factor 2 family protein [Noviherbaspirillum humi]SNT09211.1 hypothetical protein SAMN06265795_113105 [Noviherbaspirillum humi]